VELSVMSTISYRRALTPSLLRVPVRALTL
jgi:hypothetical protein